MERVFADAFYYIALLVRKDADHARAQKLQADLGDTRIVTTQAILHEILAYVAGAGPILRQEAVVFVRDLQSDPYVTIVTPTDALFDRALALYEARPDKGYSLTDTMSMVICRDLDITNVLTHDRHFAQEGLTVLL